MDYMTKYQQWLESPYVDDATKKKLAQIKNDKKEIENRFYQDLEFGTSGLRGIIGAGTNYVNKYTIGKTAQALANYIIQNKITRKVVIAYDSRYKSEFFAGLFACILNNNGIETCLFNELKPTPLLAFAIPKLDCGMGVVITCSHNPKNYNGCKVYDDTGSPIVSPVDVDIAAFMKDITDFGMIKGLDMRLLNRDIYHILGDEIDNQFVEETIDTIIQKDLVMEHAHSLKVAYTPLNGTDYKLMKRIMKRVGVQLYTVEKQKYPNPEFTTTPYPNPEDPSTYELVEKLALEQDADVVISTDPDADRLGVMIKNKEGGFLLLTGNQVGEIFTQYLLNNRPLSDNHCIIRSIVSSSLVDEMAARKGISVLQVLTGCKYIAEKIKEFERTLEYQFLFGYEQSIGYMPSSYVRDKNGLSAALLLCEIAIMLKAKGYTIYDYLESIYQEYGYYVGAEPSIYYEGADGALKMNEIMDLVREKEILQINGISVLHKTDYLHENTGLPYSNVLKFELEDHSWFAIRPSGTEPKIKLYFQVCDKQKSRALEKLEQLQIVVKSWLE